MRRGGIREDDDTYVRWEVAMILELACQLSTIWRAQAIPMLRTRAASKISMSESPSRDITRAENKPARVDARDDKEEPALQPQPQILSPPYSCTAVPPSFASCFGSSTLMDSCLEGLLIVENRHQEINKLMSM